MPSQSHIEKLGNSPGQSWWEGTMDHWKIEREKREYKCRWTLMINIYFKKKQNLISWDLQKFCEKWCDKIFYKTFFPWDLQKFCEKWCDKIFYKTFFPFTMSERIKIGSSKKNFHENKRRGTKKVIVRFNLKRFNLKCLESRVWVNYFSSMLRVCWS